jgi:hypothetical protein
MNTTTTKTITPTDLNLSALTELVADCAAELTVNADGSITIPNGRIQAPSAPHVRRCLKAGLVEVISRAQLRLTPAAAAIVARRMRTECNRFQPSSGYTSTYHAKLAAKYAAGCAAIGC